MVLVYGYPQIEDSLMNLNSINIAKSYFIVIFKQEYRSDTRSANHKPKTINYKLLWF
jgi:hypothetical protein